MYVRNNYTDLSTNLYRNIYIYIRSVHFILSVEHTSSLGMNLISMSIFSPGSKMAVGGSTSKYFGVGLSFILRRT